MKKTSHLSETHSSPRGNFPVILSCTLQNQSKRRQSESWCPHSFLKMKSTSGPDGMRKHRGDHGEGKVLPILDEPNKSEIWVISSSIIFVFPSSSGWNIMMGTMHVCDLNEPRNANPLGDDKSMKLERRLSGHSWSNMSNRTDLHWADLITRVKFPVPAKNSSHSISWQRANETEWGLEKLWNLNSESCTAKDARKCSFRCFSPIMPLRVLGAKWGGICRSASQRLWWRTLSNTQKIPGLLQIKGPKTHQDNHHIFLGLPQHWKNETHSYIEGFSFINIPNLYDRFPFSVQPEINPKKLVGSLGTWREYSRHSKTSRSGITMARDEN